MAESFLYKWPGHRAVFVKPGIHDLEARAEWSFLMSGPQRNVWWNYKVERLQAVIVDPDTEYALEFNMKTDTWTLYRLGKVGEEHGTETVEEQFTHLRGEIQHYGIVQNVILTLEAAAFLFLLFTIKPGLYASLIHHKSYIFMAVGSLLSLLVLYAVVRWEFLRRGRLEAQRKGWAVIHLRRESRHRPGSSSIRIRKVDGKRTHFFLSRFLRCSELILKPGMHDLEVHAKWSVDTVPTECAWYHYKADQLQAVFMDPKTEYALDYNWKTDTWTLYRLGKVGKKHGTETVEERFAHLGGQG